MLKKLLTGCLTIVAAAALAVPAMAAEMSGKVGGRAVADLISTSYAPGATGAKSYSYTDMYAQGRIDYTLTATEGDWKATGKVEYRSKYVEDAYGTVQVLQKFVKFENEAVSFALGTQWFGIVYLTPYIGVSDSFDRYGYGIFGVTSPYLRDDRLIVGIKSIGLQLEYSSKKVDSGTTTGLQQSQMGLEYNGTFGPLTVAASYQSVALAGISNLVSAKDTTDDGASKTDMAVAVRYAVMEGMFVEFDYDAISTKNGLAGAKTATTNTMGLAFAMALSEQQGFAVAYDSSVYSSGVSGAEDLTTTFLTGTFNQKIAGQQVYVGYTSMGAEALSSGKKVTNTTSTIALGGRVTF